MFKNYLTVAIRNIKRHKLYSAINIVGLAVGMACCFLILLFVMDELSYDKQHPNADRLYRVVSGPNSAVTPPVLATTMQAHLSQIDKITRLIAEYRALIGSDEQRSYEDRFYWADANVFEVFHLPLIKGDSETALQEPNTVVLTETKARKYFGNIDPVGQTLKLGNRRELRVTGVLKTTHKRSHINPDFVASAVSMSGKPMTEWHYFVGVLLLLWWWDFFLVFIQLFSCHPFCLFKPSVVSWA